MLLISSPPAMLAPFSGFQCLSVCTWTSPGELGAPGRQTEAALRPLQIGEPFCPLLIECLTAGCSPHVNNPALCYLKALPLGPRAAIAASDPDSSCHLQLEPTPLRHDEWHFYESSRNHTDAGLSGDKNMLIRGRRGGPGLVYPQMSLHSVTTTTFLPELLPTSHSPTDTEYDDVTADPHVLPSLLFIPGVNSKVKTTSMLCEVT